MACADQGAGPAAVSDARVTGADLLADVESALDSEAGDSMIPDVGPDVALVPDIAAGAPGSTPIALESNIGYGPEADEFKAAGAVVLVDLNGGIVIRVASVPLDCETAYEALALQQLQLLVRLDGTVGALEVGASLVDEDTRDGLNPNGNWILWVVTAYDTIVGASSYRVDVLARDANWLELRVEAAFVDAIPAPPPLSGTLTARICP